MIIVPGFIFLFSLYIKNVKYDRKSENIKNYKSIRTLQIVKKIIIIAMPLTISAILGSLKLGVFSNVTP